MKTLGIHHISQIVGHPQNNIDFYASFLGLQLIKKAVNFDDRETYHFYYGNNEAQIGSVITTFPTKPEAGKGILGGGQVSSIYYIIPKGSFSFWRNRLEQFNIKYELTLRFGQRHIKFLDDSNISVELVESELGNLSNYHFNGVDIKNQIKGFYGAQIYSRDPNKTYQFMIDVLGLDFEDEDDNYYRLSFQSEIGKYLDIDKVEHERGKNTIGTVHHIALSVEDEKTLIKFQNKIKELGIYVTDVKDRNFFKAIYFKEPGGTIIELSTLKPGFDQNEIDKFGENLYLPNHFETYRAELEKTLIPIKVRQINKLRKYSYETQDGFKKEEEHFELIDQINYYANKKDLTEEEKIIRDKLRRKYIDNIKSNFKNVLESIEVVD